MYWYNDILCKSSAFDLFVGRDGAVEELRPYGVEQVNCARAITSTQGLLCPFQHISHLAKCHFNLTLRLHRSSKEYEDSLHLPLEGNPSVDPVRRGWRGNQGEILGTIKMIRPESWREQWKQMKLKSRRRHRKSEFTVGRITNFI